MSGYWKGSIGLALIAAVAGCDRGMGEEELARAHEFELGVEETARILAPVGDLPNDASVVQAFADFWSDYSLLAWAVNQDRELDRLDIERLLGMQVEHERMVRLRAQVVQARDIPDDELRQMFERDRPRDEIRARHVLLRFPPAATPPQRDSVRALAEQIRDRARAGADFGELARTYSADPGSASQGGDLGFFGRGQMVVSFEDAAFATPPGRVSDVVESDYGLHVIRVEERRNPPFEDVADDYRMQVRSESMLQAESIFLTQLEGTADVRLMDGARQIVREVAAAYDVKAPPTGQAAARELSTYVGGSVTAGDLWEFLYGQPREILDQIDAGTDEQLDNFIRQLTRDELLLREAERRQVVVAPEEIGSFEGELRFQYRRAAEVLGLDSIAPAGGESLDAAIDREVMALMGRIVTGTQEIVPLGGMASPLRALYDVEVSQAAVPLVIQRVGELRAAGFTGDAPAGGTVPGAVPPAGGAGSGAPTPGAAPAPTPGTATPAAPEGGAAPSGG